MSLYLQYVVSYYPITAMMKHVTPASSTHPWRLKVLVALVYPHVPEVLDLPVTDT